MMKSPKNDENRGPHPGFVEQISVPLNDRFAQDSRAGALRVVSRQASATYLANPGRVQHTHAVACTACGRTHLHRVRSLEPVVRRPHCGGPRYRVSPARSVRIPEPRRPRVENTVALSLETGAA